MSDLVAQCKWPKLPEKYDLALRSAVGFILDHYAPAGIVFSGTILRGTPDPSSDLDLYVIHNQPFRQRLQKWFGNVPAEIFINPPVVVERYFKAEQAARRPITAHILATGFVVLDNDPVIQQLRQKAEKLLLQPPEAPKDMIYQRYLAALLYEDALDVVEKDPATAEMIVNRAVVEMLNFCFINAGKFIPGPKSLLKELEKIDFDAAGLARLFYQENLLIPKMELAGQLADKTVGARGFFEWESAPDEVAAQNAAGVPISG